MNKQWKYLMIAIMIACITTVHERSFAQGETTLEGTWENEHRTRKVQFVRQGDEWYGKVIWVADDSKIKVGDTLFYSLVWNGRQFNGKAITPKGKVNCAVLFDGSDKLRITASKGGMSRTVYWNRAK